MNIALSNVTLSCHIFRSFFHQHLQEQSLIERDVPIYEMWNVVCAFSLKQ